MALAVPNTWSNPSSAGVDDAETLTNPTPGNWLIAVVAWRVIDGTTPGMHVGDTPRNLWSLLYDSTTTAHAVNTAAGLQVQVWAAPAVYYAGWDLCAVHAAAQQITASDVGHVALRVFEVSGFVGNNLTVDDVVVGTATAATSLSLTSAAPAGGANCFFLGAAITDTTAAITATGSGFTPLTATVYPAAPVLTEGPSQWKAATTAQTASWSCGSPVNWAGVLVAIRETGTPIEANTPYVAGSVAQASGVAATVTVPLTQHAIGQGDSVLVAIGTSGGATVLGVADSAGNTYAPAGAPPGGTPQALLWKADNARPTTGSDTVTVTCSTAGNAYNVAVVGYGAGYGGVLTLDGAPGTGADTSTAPAATATARNSGYDIVIGVISNGNGGGAPAWTSPWVPLATLHSTGTAWTALAWRPTDDTAPVTAQATIVSAAWTALAAAFRPKTAVPVARLGIGLGFDMATPLSAVRFTDQTDRLAGAIGEILFGSKRGIPYELGVTQPEATDLQIRNEDGAFTPRPVTAAATANAAGTQATIKLPDAQVADTHVADFFQLYSPGGATLKENTVFQVTALASAGGTTTVTFKRADGQGGGAQAATATGDIYAGIPIDLNTPWRYDLWWPAPGGGPPRWWPVASGWLGDLKQLWQTNYWGVVPAVGMDALTTLTAADLSRLRGEILRRNPKYFWSLGAPAGSPSAPDESGNGGPPLVQVTSKYGAGSGRADFGASTQNVDPTGTGTPLASIAGDTGSGWQVSGLLRADMNANKGFALRATGLDTDISQGVTILGVALLVDPTDEVINSNDDPTVFIIRDTDPAAGIGRGAQIRLQVSHAPATFARGIITVWDKDTHAATSTSLGTPQIVGAAWNLWAVTFNRTSWSAYSSVGGILATGACDLTAIFDLLDIGGEADAFFNGNSWPGIHTDIAIFPRRLSEGELDAIYNALNDGEYSLGGNDPATNSQKVTTKLNTAGWKGARDISPSDVLFSVEGPPSGTVANTAAALAAQDDGLWFLDAAGQAQWRGHVTGYYQSVRATLGERSDLGEIPYTFSGQPLLGFDATYLYNDIQAANQAIRSGSAITSEKLVAADAASQGKRGQRTYPLATKLEQPEDVYGLAWTLLARYKDPALRAAMVDIDPASNPAAWAFCLGVEVGDLVNVLRRPMNAPAITVPCRVIQVQPRSGPGVARYTLALAAADPPTVVLGGPHANIGAGTIGW